MQSKKPYPLNFNKNSDISNFNYKSKVTDSQNNHSKLESDSNSLRETQMNHSQISSDKNVKLTDTDRGKRKKFKEVGVVNEYLASEIPNNIGNEAIDKLADYVNGSNGKDGIKSIKPDRRLKMVNGSKKQENEKALCNTNIICEEIVSNNGVYLINKEKVNNIDFEANKQDQHINDFQNIDKINISVNMEKSKLFFNSYSDDNGNQDEDDFFRVVKHKTRNKTKILKPNSFSQSNKSFDSFNKIHFKPHEINSGDIMEKISEINFIAKNKIININEKKKLNCFIYHLWIEFQRKHEKYVKEQNNLLRQSIN